MLSKEEIENSKRNLKRVLETDPLLRTIDFQYNDVDNLLDYAEQLETQKQKLIEKLEEDKMEQFDNYIIYLIESYLKILKGDKE